MNINNFISNSNIKFNLPLSNGKHKCLGPCYPPNYPFYHPYHLNVVNTNNYACPIESTKDENNDVIFFDKCNKKDFTENYKLFDIFDDAVQIANSDLSFLEQIYNITNIDEAIQFINDSLNILPFYTQKRIINSIFMVWIHDNKFPHELVSEKIKIIIYNIFKIDIDLEKIYKKIINFKNKKNFNDIFLYFINKYSK
jgi:hypothetical protein